MTIFARSKKAAFSSEGITLMVKKNDDKPESFSLCVYGAHIPGGEMVLETYSKRDEAMEVLRQFFVAASQNHSVFEIFPGW